MLKYGAKLLIWSANLLKCGANLLDLHVGTPALITYASQVTEDNDDDTCPPRHRKLGRHQSKFALPQRKFALPQRKFAGEGV